MCRDNDPSGVVVACLMKVSLDPYTNGFRNYLSNLNHLQIKKHLQFDKLLGWEGVDVPHFLPPSKSTPNPQPQLGRHQILEVTCELHP